MEMGGGRPGLPGTGGPGWDGPPIVVRDSGEPDEPLDEAAPVHPCGAARAGGGRGVPIIDLVETRSQEDGQERGTEGQAPQASPVWVGPEDLLSLVGEGGSTLSPPEGWTRAEVIKADAKVRATRRRHHWPEWLVRLDRECRSDGRLPYWARWALTMPVTRAPQAAVEIGRAHV